MGIELAVLSLLGRPLLRALELESHPHLTSTFTVIVLDVQKYNNKTGAKKKEIEKVHNKVWSRCPSASRHQFCKSSSNETD